MGPQSTDEFVRPRPADLTPDPAKFKPSFIVPDDPNYCLYTDTTHFDSTTEECKEMENMYRRMGVDDAKTKPDGYGMIVVEIDLPHPSWRFLRNQSLELTRTLQ